MLLITPVRSLHFANAVLTLAATASSYYTNPLSRILCIMVHIVFYEKVWTGIVGDSLTVRCASLTHVIVPVNCVDGV